MREDSGMRKRLFRTRLGPRPAVVPRFLQAMDAAPLPDRYAVLAYGSNLVPGQLVRKLGADAVAPVLDARLPRTDIAYDLISDHGYAYAELLPDQGPSEVEAGITLLDREQLDLVRSSEKNYRSAEYPYAIRMASWARDYLRGASACSSSPAEESSGHRDATTDR